MGEPEPLGEAHSPWSMRWTCRPRGEVMTGKKWIATGMNTSLHFPGSALAARLINAGSIDIGTAGDVSPKTRIRRLAEFGCGIPESPSSQPSDSRKTYPNPSRNPIPLVFPSDILCPTLLRFETKFLVSIGCPYPRTLEDEQRLTGKLASAGKRQA